MLPTGSIIWHLIYPDWVGLVKNPNLSFQDVVSVLLQHGADENSRDKNWMTPGEEREKNQPKIVIFLNRYRIRSVSFDQSGNPY